MFDVNDERGVSPVANGGDGRRPEGEELQKQRLGVVTAGIGLGGGTVGSYFGEADAAEPRGQHGVGVQQGSATREVDSYTYRWLGFP